MEWSVINQLIQVAMSIYIRQQYMRFISSWNSTNVNFSSHRDGHENGSGVRFDFIF
jgi:hypothetical protein